MLIQARTVAGFKTNAQSVIDTRLDWESAVRETITVTHSIELVSGVSATHGGAAAGVYLHYKNSEVDADSDGTIDYTNTQINCTLAEAGTAVIKICAKIDSLADRTAAQGTWKTWSDAKADERQRLNEAHGVDQTARKDGLDTWLASNAEPAGYVPSIIKSNNLTIEWSEDSTGSWV